MFSILCFWIMTNFCILFMCGRKIQNVLGPICWFRFSNCPVIMGIFQMSCGRCSIKLVEKIWYELREMFYCVS